ncbi:Retrovirus-related Pol polyprotein from transposon RE1 [Vitis vinifera]|uniref:Retrovirus-related Pol polyprotein from transposon RE1 n=1 Tax=Vitis vinifera TaxID=29760 RepID=A0A438GTS9_VITVI|nr:Retrovirus-related Pol polyprotein from transposon RE1 [Vitis vinifera]
MTRKTMRNRGFEPWTFRSCLGYQHFVINDNNRDQRKKDSKKTSIATVAEIKTEANVAEKASALVAATDHGDRFHPLDLPHKKLFPQPMITIFCQFLKSPALSCIVIFWPEFCVIKDIQTRQTIGCGIKWGKLYYLDLQSKDSNKLQQALMADGSEGEKKKSEIWLWHRRLGHASFGYLKKLFPSLFAKSDISGFRCDICELAKSHRVSFPLILNKSRFLLWLYILIMTWLCLMKTKDEVNLLFQKFHKMIETQYNAKVRVLRSDNGGEYQSSDLQKYLEGHGIIHQTTCSNTPQQNGVAERKNRHLLEVVRASLIAAKTPISYWGEAITSAAYLINRGEYHKEIQTLDYDYHISEENESGQSELVNQEAGVLNLEPDPFMKRLPHRHNRAMNEEMKSLQKNETWELVECPPGKKPVGCRWIYTVKYKADGSIERFKARLVAKGYTQTYGIDYTETFAPVAKINTVRVLLSLAANLDWPLQQFDVKNAFCMASYLKKYIWIFHQDAWCQKSNVKGVQIEEVIVWVEAIPESMVWKETGMSGCQPVNTPIEEGLKLCVEPNQVSTDKGRYQRLVGRLMYLAHTRPDLAYALSVSIEVYTDADWAGAVDDRRSTSGYFTFVGGNLVTWKSKKQNVVARSSAEAEFRGMALGLCEALWLRLLLQDLGYLSRQPIRLFCDNKAACDIAHNPVQHDRTKHVEVDRFFIKEKLDDKIVELPKIRSEDQLADILTKAVSSQVFSKFLDKLGMCDIYAPT